MNTKAKLEGFGYTALGLGFLFQAAKSFGLFGLGPVDIADKGKQRSKLAGLGNAEGEAMRAAKPVIGKVTTYTVSDIKERVAHIQDRVRKDSLKPEVKEMAMAVLTRKESDGDGNTRWAVPEKDYEAEITALYKAVQDPASPIALRYTRDHNTVDQFFAANKLASLHGPSLKGGDCDDGTILLGSLLRSVGYPVRLRVIQDVNASSWSHIYLLVGTPPPRPTKWIALDWSVRPPKPAGWEAPGARDVARTGKPAGVVAKLLDFNV
jgi:hypothetical protein